MRRLISVLMLVSGLVISVSSLAAYSTGTNTVVSSITQTGASFAATITTNSTGSGNYSLNFYVTAPYNNFIGGASPATVAVNGNSTTPFSSSATALTCGTSYTVSGVYLPDNYIVGTAYTSFTTLPCTAQTALVTNSPQTFNGTPIAALVTCSSGVAATNVKYNNSSTVPTNAGTYTVTADCAATNTHSPITNSAAGNFVIATAAPTVSVTNPSVTYTGSAIPATVSCSSGGAVTNVKYNGISTVPTNAGTYAVTANCAANSNYSALTDAAAGNFEITTVTQTLTLSPATANVNAGVGQALTLSGAQGTGQVTYNVSSSGAVTCTLSNESNTGVTVTGNNGAGTCSVTASIVADNNYRAAMSNTAIVSVNLVPQTGFTLNLSITSVTTNTPVNLSTTGGEGNGGVTYTAEAQGVQPSSIQNLSATTQSILQCNINGTILTPTGGTGVCVVTAFKAADGNYAAASSTGNVTVRATPAPNPIPTLSEWARIMMMLAMIATAGFYGWRMKQR